MNPSPRFDIGRPALKDVWVDPVAGCDDNSGATRAKAFKTISAAWASIPPDTSAAGHGWRILLAPGKYPPEQKCLIHLECRRGSHACPIILQPSDGPLTAELPGLSFRACSSIYVLDLKLVFSDHEPGTVTYDNVLHIADCQDALVRGVTAIGLSRPGRGYPYNVFKGNQCMRMYIEECDFGGARSNALDYVAVHYGHIVRSRFHQTECECIYVKGGSAYHLIAGNECFDSKNHGILAGQTTGFRYMVSPWLHYEAYDIKVVNNVIHDAGGGLAVFGGYNILEAWNTCYRVGSLRDTLAVGLGGRGWGHAGGEIIDDYLRQGGWCNPEGSCQFNIPNRNVAMCNNVVLNPDGFESRFAHIGFSGPVKTPPGSNLPEIARADENVRIAGNIIWNGPANKPVLDMAELEYHLAAYPTADAEELRRLNVINTLRPELMDPEHGDFRPVPLSELRNLKTCEIGDFKWDDAPNQPHPPAGNPDNQVPLDRDGKPRDASSPPGAYV